MTTTKTEAQPVLIDGRWRAASCHDTFQAVNPQSREPLADSYPVSTWADCDAALEAAAGAFQALRNLPPERIAQFLDTYAERIEARRDEIAEMAHQETAFPVSPRLKDVELVRTTNQLRQAAAAARDGSWRMPTIDSSSNIRSYLAPLGPVAVFGPNNFPLAFGSLSGGDFAAAIAAGNPVIGKANSSHPGTTRLLAVEAIEAASDTDLPTGTIQLLYRTSHDDGERLVADPRIAATAYTGSRAAGLKLKDAADHAGKLIYLELSSVNPVVVLPGAIEERSAEIVDEFTTSCLMGTGQFCTNPGIVVMIAGQSTDLFVGELVTRFDKAAAGTLLSAGVEKSLRQAVQELQEAGAEVITANSCGNAGFSIPNTLLRVSGQQFLASSQELQTEAFGNTSLLVVATDVDEAAAVIGRLEGNLTGCVYSHSTGLDDAAYDQLAPVLRNCVGRLLNDKMPTGVAVSPAMNHGGPYPATGHPHFTAVGIPAALSRFTMLQCFDNVRPHRLPVALRDPNPTGSMWRQIDGTWTQDNVSHNAG